MEPLELEFCKFAIFVVLNVIVLIVVVPCHFASAKWHIRRIRLWRMQNVVLLIVILGVILASVVLNVVVLTVVVLTECCCTKCRSTDCHMY